MKKLLLALFFLFVTLGVKGQEPVSLGAKSKVYINYIFTDNEDNVDPSDVIDLLTNQLRDKTSLIIVDSLNSADFLIEVRVIKTLLDSRKASIVIKNIKTYETIYKSKQVKGGGNAFSGFSGVRNVIRGIAKDLIKKYPKIIW